MRKQKVMFKKSMFKDEFVVKKTVNYTGLFPGDVFTANDLKDFVNRNRMIDVEIV